MKNRKVFEENLVTSSTFIIKHFLVTHKNSKKFLNLLHNRSIMSNSKLLKHGFYRSVSCTPLNVHLRRTGWNYSKNIESTSPVVPHLQL